MWASARSLVFILSVLGSHGKVSQKGVTALDLHVLKISPAARQGVGSRGALGEAEQNPLNKR